MRMHCLRVVDHALEVDHRRRRVARNFEQTPKWLACVGLAGSVRIGERLPDPIDRSMRTERSWAMFDPGALVLATAAHTLKLHLLQGGAALTLLLERGAPPEAPALDAGLTARMREILCWLVAGKSNAEIAPILAIRPRTVHKHLEHVFRKLGVQNRTAAVLRALDLTRSNVS